jgi:endonuclease III-like uncharacterized protein
VTPLFEGKTLKIKDLLADFIEFLNTITFFKQIKVRRIFPNIQGINPTSSVILFAVIYDSSSSLFLSFSYVRPLLDLSDKLP